MLTPKGFSGSTGGGITRYCIVFLIAPLSNLWSVSKLLYPNNIACIKTKVCCTVVNLKFYSVVKDTVTYNALALFKFSLFFFFNKPLIAWNYTKVLE